MQVDDETSRVLDACWPEIGQWLRAQRWYPRKNGPADASLAVVAALPLVTDVDLRALLLVVGAAAGDRYQVPVVLRRGSVAHSIAQRGGWSVLDGARDADFAAALFLLAVGGRRIEGRGASAEGEPLRGLPPHPTVLQARALGGEQSNSSIVLELARCDGAPCAPAILKLYRILQPGGSPEVEVQSALAAAGSPHVPPTLAAIRGTWPGPHGQLSGHLAVVQEYLAGAEDGWTVALAAARSGTPFTESARALGAATSEVHRTLASVLGSAPATRGTVEDSLTTARRRAKLAIDLVPALLGRRPAIERIFARAASVTWPAFQRVHGDLHLGQVLRVPGGRWVLLDFEGEPLRPIDERRAPDSPLRDVAGMLRSFDYAAGTVVLEVGDAEAAQAWADTARGAFLAGYSDCQGVPIDAFQVVLDALELDKALYECLYEAGNRPAWLPIPERAVLRLTEEVPS